MLPKKINLGCGHTIKVELVPRSTIQTLIGHNTAACWVCDPPQGSAFFGVVFVDSSLSQAEQKMALYHELLHACIDLFQHVVDSTK